ncbi:MAG: sigma 54-interacting transcriptional regulator [Candidatus Acidiferrales bacterium]|jgi:two-component system, NtrC family, response regulator AtoC
MTSNGVGIASLKEEWGFVGGMCAAMQTLENVVAEIAPTNIPVLLMGESGAGKEMFARRIHHLSANGDEPLVKIACASMNPANFASELGLSKSDISAEEVKALNRTVFFDEISELDSSCQRSLVYALPDGEARPRRGSLGARVISTTNRNLDDEMRAGRFRSELYYRINGVCLRLPPLRDRKEDIPLLVESFLTKYAAEFGRPRPSLSPRALRMLLDYSWPGNIRELENAVKKIVALGAENLALPDLVAEPVETRTEVSETRSYSLKAAARAASREAEREMILEALARTRWNRKRAAQELQISYKSLLYKLKQIGLPDSRTE